MRTLQHLLRLELALSRNTFVSTTVSSLKKLAICRHTSPTSASVLTSAPLLIAGVRIVLLVGIDAQVKDASRQTVGRQHQRRRLIATFGLFSRHVDLVQ